jgi:hypothetical protein
MVAIMFWSSISFAAGYLAGWYFHRSHRDAKGRFTKGA